MIAEQCQVGMAFLLLLPKFMTANMYDVVMPSYLSGCPHGCANWSAVGQDQLWATGKVPTDAGNNCAMPAAQSGTHECDCGGATAV